MNNAFKRMGISRAAFDPAYRQNMQEAGLKAGNSPQEVALCMIAQLPRLHRMAFNPEQVNKYILRHKIDREAPAIQDALTALELWVLL